MGNPIGGVPASGVTQLQTPGAVSSGAERVGQNNGRTFVASNPASPIANSNMSEEATALVSKFKKPDDFKISKGKSESERQLELIEKIKIVEEIQGVDEFKRSFPKESTPGRDEYLEKAREKFGDPYHEYIALYELAVDSKAQPGDEVFQAIESLEQKHPRYIEIGKEISKAAGHLAEKYKGDSYPEINKQVFGHVKDHKSLGAAFKDLYKADGAVKHLDNTEKEQDFLKVIDLELRSSSSQLNMMTSSTEDTHIRAVINRMTALKRIVGIHDNCMETQDQISRPPNNVQPFDGHQYMEKVLGILDKQFVVANDFTQLLDDMGMAAQPIPVKIFLINKTAILIRDIPEETFVNQQTKDSLIAAVGEEQDSLALAEENVETMDKNFGKVGEVEVSLDGFVRSGEILGDIGVSLTGSNGDQLPGILSPHATPVLGQQPEESVDQQPELAQSSNIQSATAAEVQESQGETSNSADTVFPDTTKNTYSEVTAKSSTDGLSDKALMASQDKLLDQARGLQQQKDTDFVYGCSLTALEHALNDGADTLSALNEVASRRGKGVFAKGLKIAITPEGSGKELRLIPPDQKALQAWVAQNPDKNVADLVRTAITVLEENRDSDFDLEKINNDLANLKESIAQIDAKVKKKPFKRLQGAEAFDRLDYSHNFRIRADQEAVLVAATLDAPGMEEVTVTQKNDTQTKN